MTHKDGCKLMVVSNADPKARNTNQYDAARCNVVEKRTVIQIGSDPSFFFPYISVVAEAPMGGVRRAVGTLSMAQVMEC